MSSSISSISFTPVVSHPLSPAEDLRSQVQRRLITPSDRRDEGSGGGPDPLERMKRVTTFLNEDGTLLDDATMELRIRKRIRQIKATDVKNREIYSLESISVTKGPYEFGGSKVLRLSQRIEIRRKLHIYDFVPFRVIRDLIINRKNSDYLKDMECTSMRDLILGAKPVKKQIEALIEATKNDMIVENTKIDDALQADLNSCAEVVKTKYENDQLDFTMTEEDCVGKSALFSERLNKFLKAFDARYVETMKEAHVSFRAAFWQDRNILIYIPVETVVNRGETTYKIAKLQTAYLETSFNYGLTALVVKLAPIFFDSEEE